VGRHSLARRTSAVVVNDVMPRKTHHPVSPLHAIQPAHHVGALLCRRRRYSLCAADTPRWRWLTAKATLIKSSGLDLPVLALRDRDLGRQRRRDRVAGATSNLSVTKVRPSVNITRVTALDPSGESPVAVVPSAQTGTGVPTAPLMAVPGACLTPFNDVVAFAVHLAPSKPTSPMPVPNSVWSRACSPCKTPRANG
jgi:hypothetical protein